MKGMQRFISTQVPAQIPGLLKIAIGDRNFVLHFFSCRQFLPGVSNRQQFLENLFSQACMPFSFGSERSSAIA